MGAYRLLNWLLQFEEGAKLLKVCQKELKQAELKIQKLDISDETRSDFDAEQSPAILTELILII